ncbi:MAG TPA: hypothetical protein VMW24_11165 [Sedimentisphaerales bacterium]|nr:hypothetical protein [Sedimentisphaerales bacterium]
MSRLLPVVIAESIDNQDFDGLGIGAGIDVVRHKDKSGGTGNEAQ